MSDPVTAIARQIGRRCAALAGTAVRHRHSAAWRSLLFEGARHRIGLSVAGERREEALDVIRDSLSASDLAVAGHLIVDLRIADIERGDGEALVMFDMLTVEAAEPEGR
jgi:hypothetical protein